MEGAKEHFVEISLESVLRKASRLEDSLRSCKDRASLPSSSTVSSLPQAHGPSSLLQGPVLHGPVSPVLPQGPVSTSPPSTTDLSDQWQKLTAYIVSLEKEVQYYKQLVQDVQGSNSQTPDSQTTRIPGRPVREHLAPISAGQEGTLSAEYWRELLDKDQESRALLLIFSFLSTSELHHAALVCRKWYSVSRHPRLWKEVVMSDVMLEPEVSHKEAWLWYTTM